MTATGSTSWRFLIVEDNKDIARQITEACEMFAPEGTSATGQAYNNFDEAKEALEHSRFDLVILDLKDDKDRSGSDSAQPGLDVFEQIKKLRFVPVVFYSALANTIDIPETKFLRKVEKTQGISKLKDEIQGVFRTGLPALSRHIENEQREYMWDFVTNHWRDLDNSNHHADLVYLLARRLARMLQGDAIRSFVRKIANPSSVPTSPDDAHPIELYVMPPVDSVRQPGDILSTGTQGKEEYWVLLTPSCDFAQGKAEHVILAKCEPLAAQKEFLDWIAAPAQAQKLKDLICDKRTGKREIKTPENATTQTIKLQPDRFKFLPGTFFIPDLIVDFQQLRSAQTADLDQMTRVASLDSPFAEALLARFTRYFSRLGTPDIDAEVVIARIQSGIPTTTTAIDTKKPLTPPATTSNNSPRMGAELQKANVKEQRPTTGNQATETNRPQKPPQETTNKSTGK
jgi:CheY-like chemotaxis protein